MLRLHERCYFLSCTRYSTDAFLRRTLARTFGDAGLPRAMYRSFDEAAHALAQHVVAGIA
jgi:hypothetical protein